MVRILLLLPTTTYRAPAFMEAARRLGVDVTVGSEEPSTVTNLNPAGLLTLDLAHAAHAAQQVVAFAERHPFGAVVPVDDQVTVVGAAIAQALRLPSNSVASVAAARDKHRMRQLLEAAAVPQPKFRLCSFDDNVIQLAESLSFPCVVKPLSLAASQGVIRADDAGEFERAVTRVATIGQQAAAKQAMEPPAARNFLVEEFVGGPEVAVEGLLTDGSLRVLAIFDKPDPLDGPYFEETLYVTPSRLDPPVRRRIGEVTRDACAALGLVHGPIHAELRVARRGDGPGPVVIEVNARSIGGLCSRVLRFGTGLSLEELIIRHAIDPQFEPPVREDRPAGVMMIPIPRAGTLRDFTGIDAARSVPGIEEVTISARRGQLLVPLPEGSNYLGFIFARGESPESVERSLREAHRRIEFSIEPDEGIT
jgi:biotin carboxylase